MTVQETFLHLVEKEINKLRQKNDIIRREVTYTINQQDTYTCFETRNFFVELRKELQESLLNMNAFIKLYDKYIATLLIGFPNEVNFSEYYSTEIIFEPVLNVKLYRKIIQLLSAINEILILTISDQKNISFVLQLLQYEKNHAKNRIEEIEDELSKVPKILTCINKIIVEPVIKIKPRVSVITTSYNLAIFIEETLRSVSNQNYEAFEHIVIDGASSDGSVDILKKYPGIILVSEKDMGYPDAFWKGLHLAQGEYILQCAVTDAYASTEWIESCVNALDADSDISLVWGYPAYLTQDSKPGDISFPEFHYVGAPQMEAMMGHWLKTFMHYPEGNLCARKSVMLKCYPSLEDCKKDIIDWLEFSYRFNSLGFVSFHLPVMANYGRTHGDQLGDQLIRNGQMKIYENNYKSKVRKYRLFLLLGIQKHIFINEHGKQLNIEFDKNKFIRVQIYNWFRSKSKYFDIKKYIQRIKRASFY